MTTRKEIEEIIIRTPDGVNRLDCLAPALESLVKRECIKARLEEIEINMTCDSERLNKKRITELQSELEKEGS